MTMQAVEIGKGKKKLIAEEIKSAREKAGLSQSTLARRAGISNGLVSMIERGKTKARPETIAKINQVLNGSSEGLDLLIQKIVDMGYDVTVSRRS